MSVAIATGAAGHRELIRASGSNEAVSSPSGVMSTISSRRPRDERVASRVHVECPDDVDVEAEAFEPTGEARDRLGRFLRLPCAAAEREAIDDLVRRASDAPANAACAAKCCAGNGGLARRQLMIVSLVEVDLRLTSWGC